VFFGFGKLENSTRCGQVAQSVERSPEKAGVGGSIPSLATILLITYKPRFSVFIPFHCKIMAREIRLIWKCCACAMWVKAIEIANEFVSLKQRDCAHSAPF
jgi:hypothetical protein